MNYYVLYRIEDQIILSFVAEDIYDQYVPADGQAVTTNYLEYGEEEIPYPNQVSVDENGTASKIEE